MHGKAPQSDALVKGILIVVAAVAVAFFLFQAIGQKPAQITPTPFVATATPSTIPTPAFVEVTGLEVAQSAVKFLNEMKLADGTYVYSVDCDSSGCSKKSHLQGYPQSNAWAALAHVGLYRATRDKTHLDVAVREVEKEIEICNASTDPEKNCKWALVQAYEVYKENKDEKIKDFILKTASSVMFSVAEEPQGSAMLQSILARELAIAYQLSGNDAFLKKALRFNDAAKQALDSDGRAAFANGFPVRLEECWQRLAELQLYEATKNESYLSSVNGFFDGIGSAGEIAESGGEFFRNFEIVTQLHPCIESLQVLSAETKDAKYAKTLSAVASYLAEASWDSQHSKKYDANGAFVTLPCQQKGEQSVCISNGNEKTITDNAYGIFLLSAQKAKMQMRRTSSQTFGKVFFNVIQFPKVTELAQAINWTHFDTLHELIAVPASDSPNTFYVSYFVDLGAPLTNAVISVDGEKFSFEGAPSCYELEEMTGACTRRYEDRSEIQYVATYENGVKGKTYEITLSSSQKTAKITYKNG